MSWCALCWNLFLTTHPKPSCLGSTWGQQLCSLRESFRCTHTIRNFWQKNKKIKAGALTVELRDDSTHHVNTEIVLPSPKRLQEGWVGWLEVKVPNVPIPNVPTQWFVSKSLTRVGEMVWQPLTNTMFWRKPSLYLLSLNSQNISFILATNFRAWCWFILWKSVKRERNGT